MNQNNAFLDMALSNGMQKTLKEVGFLAPTPIQEQAIPELLQGFDLLGQAQTGTGKTGAFSIPLIELVDENEGVAQALVVCPTRELCLQVCQEIKRLSAHKDRLETIALYGGQAIDQQFRALKKSLPQIIVATPGRLFDHLRRKSVDLSQVRMIVLDEADEMLDMGFRPEIEQIFDLLPEENQRILFSATMAKPIKDLAVSYLKNPKVIKTESKSLTVSTIEQSYFKVRAKEKTELLCRLLDLKDPKLAVVFCNAKSIADEIVDEIINRGFEAGVLHGDLSQNQRDRVMAKFRAGIIRVLVATDVAARGLDIDDVELVINYHLPHDPEDYVHRIGRTGRAGRIGSAVSLVEARDNARLRKISHFAKIEIKENQPPSISDVKTAKIKSIINQVKGALELDAIKEYRTFLSKQKISAEDVASGMLLLALKKFDENARNDVVFEDLRDKKYSNYGNDNKFGNRREGRRPFRRNDDRPRTRDDGFRKGKPFKDRERTEFSPQKVDVPSRERTVRFSTKKPSLERQSFSDRKGGRFEKKNESRGTRERRVFRDR